MLEQLRKIKRALFSNRRANTIAENLRTWSEHDWSRRGEEWSNAPGWKESLLTHVLVPHVPVGSQVLEIGPGGGRWTEHLLARAARVWAVDLTPRCLEVCRERFPGANLVLILGDGRSLPGVASGSIDRVWSWDVLVHVASSEVRPYVQEIARVLVPGGQALLHHSRDGRRDLGWRSDMTAELMRTFAAEAGLTLTRQFDTWGEGVRIWPNLPPGERDPDIVSVLTR